MMTLYLTFETIETGRLSMSDKIKISQEAASQAPSKLELEPGEEITVSDAVRALITKSANDVAVALAEKVGGSEKNFVRLMNTRARDLGMSKTHFENASGLPNSDQVTTARDMITLGLRLQDDFPNFYPLFATRAFTFNRSTYRNHNTMLNNFQGVDGIKTGYTQKSGFNLVSSVRRGGRHVVGAVFGGASAATRNGEMRNLITRALSRASTTKTRKPAPSLIAKLKSAPKLAERPKPKEQPKLQVAEAPVAVPQPKPFAPATKPAPVAAAPAIAKAPAAKPAPSAPVAAPAVAKAAPAPAIETAEAPTPVAVAEPVTVASAEASPAPVDVFKVKRVMVAPRQGPIPPPPSADQTTDMAPEETTSEDTQSTDTAAESVSVTPPPGDAVFTLASTTTTAPADKIAETFAAGDAPREPAETVIAKTVPGSVPMTVSVADAALPAAAAPARRPSPLDDRIAMLGAADVAPAVPAKAAAVAPAPKPVTPRPAAPTVARAPAKPAAPVELGRAPSSLQAQANQLPAAQPQRMASLQPATAAAPSQNGSQATGRFEIQIGAYGSIDEAQRALASAQGKAGKLLAGYASVTHPVQKAGRQVFRARFSGFDSARASSTCTELRRQAIDCFVMTAE